MSPRIHQINISWGGVPKRPIPEAKVGPTGIEGDRQADRRYHGGPLRALCLFALEKIEELRAEGHPIEPGSAGENITISGLDWTRLTPGTQLEIGEGVKIEITSYTAPCKKIAQSFAGGDFARISPKVHRGDARLYARVLCGGTIRTGDPVRTL